MSGRRRVPPALEAARLVKAFANSEFAPLAPEVADWKDRDLSEFAAPPDPAPRPVSPGEAAERRLRAERKAARERGEPLGRRRV